MYDQLSNLMQSVGAVPKVINPSLYNPSQYNSINVKMTGGATPDLAALYNTIKSMNPTTTTTTTNKQNASPQLQSAIGQFENQYNTLGSNTQQAYQSKLGTYNDLINTLTNLYGHQSGQMSNAAALSALSSGVSPMAAAEAGLRQQQDVLSQYFPALAGLRGQAADVGIQAQQAQQALQQSLALPFINSVLSPYYQALAGQTQTQTQTNPLAQYQMLTGLGTQLQQANMQQQQMAQSTLAAQLQNQLGWGQIGAGLQEAMGQLGLGYGQLGAQQLQNAMQNQVARQQNALELQRLMQQQQQAGEQLGFEKEKYATDWQRQLEMMGMGNKQADSLVDSILGKWGLSGATPSTGAATMPTGQAGPSQATTNIRYSPSGTAIIPEYMKAGQYVQQGTPQNAQLLQILNSSISNPYQQLVPLM